jgi:hypothetical protein
MLRMGMLSKCHLFSERTASGRGVDGSCVSRSSGTLKQGLQLTNTTGTTASPSSTSTTTQTSPSTKA